MIRAAGRRRVEQQDAAVLGGGRDDLLLAVLEHRRAGRELDAGLREPALERQRFRIERDDRVRLAVPGRRARTDRREHGAVSRERETSDDRAAALPGDDRLA